MDKLTPRDDITAQIIFIRHGETYGNIGLPTPEGYDEEDTPLTEYGLRQAQAIASYWFDGVEVAHIYSSPFTRTIQTIYPTAQKLGMTITLMPDLIEFGSTICGCDAQKIKHDFPLVIPCRNEALPAFESEAQAQKRAKKFTDYIASTYKNGETVIVCTHGTFLSHLIRAALNITDTNTFNCQVDNTSLTCVIFRNDKSLLRTANNTSHLRGLQ